MTQSFLERLQAGDVLVADGATGTNYQAEGLAPGIPPEEWVFDEPEQVVNLHRAFIAAGADIILTDSFGGTRLRLRDSQYADRAPELNRRAAELARAAADARAGVFVAGSMGPTGLLCAPFGPLTYTEAVTNYAEQAAALASGGVDLLLLETFFALEEVTAAIEGVRKVSNLPRVVSLSYDKGTRTLMGLRPAQAVKALAPLGIAAIGANCGKTLEAMEEIVQELAAASAGLPIWVKPNAGLPQLVGGVATYAVGPEEMAAYAVRYGCAGAQIVGGCCGATPAHIAAIAQAVKHSLLLAA
ncbi:MAG TPA: homocysteine S-methyltransferase family protein [Anaerolineae bacterium]|nr:homocysteine S-methyltransferase family protein [Anaerolineae bacterium]